MRRFRARRRQEPTNQMRYSSATDVPQVVPPPIEAAAGRVTESERRTSSQRFRGDIQGLRAVAVLAVLGFHTGMPLLSGGFVGVDVFFVISGFLITGLIDREIGRTGRLRLSRFWARRVRRLLPATAVVLVTVGAMTLLVLPMTRWSSVAWDIATSALYVVNWRLADQSVSYLASDDAPSPVQHYWSLAVEEQFYIVWPLMILLVLWLQRRYRLPLTRAMLTGIAAIGVPSFIWSIVLTKTSPGPAYFVSTTRLWELAIGGALAILAHRIPRLPAVWAHLLGVAGLTAIVLAVVTFDAATPFPGIAALVPTLGAAAVIAAGTVGRRTISDLVLDTPIMRDIGTLSYSLYLWHWPLLIGAAAMWGEDNELPVTIAVTVVGFSVVPAWLTHRLVEAPIHRAKVFVRLPGWAAVLGVVCTAIGVATAVIVSLAVPKQPSYAVGGEAPGAAVLDAIPAQDPDGRPADSVDLLVPDVLAAREDLATLGGEPCISELEGTELEACSYGPEDADVTMALVGDSKAHQWLPAFQRIADERGWRILTYLKSACPLARVDIKYEDRANQDCAEYNETRYDRLHELESIDYVVTSQVASQAYLGPNESQREQTDAMVEDLRRTWTGLEDAGRQVIVLVDNPNPEHEVIECVAEHGDELSACAFPRAIGAERGGAPAQLAALEGLDGVSSVDVNDYICPGDMCPAVIGNVLIYRRGSHLTATYVDSLTPRLDEALIAAMR
ncbi:acyltransferase [Jiangella ureilytica]|uniref:Acyltransferase n=1 Tax=Jiangella ureilytica TaxID=2530374 RepID=A0A4R4RXF5_9ACTN|nr:acyltransferase family protein [Jiangella ureilytica]TDC54424.1 acyltransferase [Jiangella ureilytica]